MIIDLKCKECNHIFEDLIKYEDPNPVCPLCQAATERLLSTTANYTGVMTKYVNRKLDRLGPEGSKFKD